MNRYDRICLYVPSFTPTGLIQDNVEGGYISSSREGWNRWQRIFNHPRWKYHHWTQGILAYDLPSEAEEFFLEVIYNNDIHIVLQNKINEFFGETGLFNSFRIDQ